MLPTSTLYLTKSGDSMTVPVSGMASALFQEGATSFVLSDLRVHQTSPGTLNGIASTDGHLMLEDIWTGAYQSSSTPQLVVRRETAVGQIQFRFGGVIYHGRLQASADPVGSRSSGLMHLEMSFSDSSAGLSGVLRIDAQDRSVRPYAYITSVSETQPECQRFPDGSVGADLVVNGHTSRDAGTWTYSDGVSVVQQWAAGYWLPATLRLSLRARTLAPGVLSLHVAQDQFTAFGRRSDARVVDSVGPTVTDTIVSAPCGAGELDPSRRGRRPATSEEVSRPHGRDDGRV